MRHTPRLIAAILATLFFGGLGCSDDKEGSDDTTVTDTVDDSTDADDTSVVPLEYTAPDYFPDLGATADEVVAADTLSGSVRVIRDSRGIPHIYGDKVEDVSWAQGYVTARDRMFQMHTLRRAASGRLAELSGVGGLSGDFLLRLLDLRGAAEGMVTLAENEDPALFAVMQSFTAGVNAYLARARAGEEQVSLEVTLFGADTIEDWSMVDTMVIVRLQTWDLSFDMSDVARLERVIAIREAHAGTAIEGVEKDAFNFAPIDKTATLEPDGGANATGTYDLLTTLSDDFFKTFNAADLKKHVQPFDAFDKAKHHAFRGPDYGSNNWLVSGSLTASTKPLVSNDTHLALRNPAVFYQVHVSNKLAGGALNANGINFAGAPGIVLGHNDHAAWGGTVFFSDVTDAYIEQVSADGTTVTYDGAQRALIEREETFNFILTGDATTCLELAPAWAAAANPRETIVGGRCSLTVTFLHVPDRGPILPWTYTGEGAERRVTSLQWTGFKPTGELSAVWKLNMMTSVAEFKAALDEFDVGAQNWVAGFTNGDIAWYPSHQLPIRKHIAAGDTTYPPFLPMPGHSSDYAWDGFVPRDELPQATNPEKGWLATANGDPIGTSFDNDPFNEAHYLGYQWKPGFRIGRVTERLTELAARGDVTSAEMSAVQGDGRSNYGRVMTASVLEAIDAAQDGTDTRAAALLTDGNSAAVEAAEGYLRGWEALGYDAASGAGADAASDEAKASVATSIFNVWAVLAIKNALDDEGLTSGIRVERLLWRMTLDPSSMVAYDETSGESHLWDNITTADVAETKAEIIVKSLIEALAFLADPAKVGPSEQGGFGTDDMAEWRWGMLHRLKLKNNVTSTYDIPSPDVDPDGFARHCDNFCVDASHPGLTNMDFTFSSGPAIRNVYEMTEPVVFNGVIAGGQNEDPRNAHYADEMALWVQNLAPQVPFTDADVIAAKESIIDFVAPSDRP